MNKELWNIQRNFTERFWGTKGGMPVGEPALTTVTKDYLLHLMKEVTEVLDQISFKMHRGPKDFVDRNNVLEEMVDCQKFLWGLMQVWNFTYEDFDKEFRRKSAVVEQRFTQERVLKEYRDAPCVLVDIDGVLSDYPRCFYKWFAGTRWITIAKAEMDYHSLALDEKESVKRAYRQSGAKANLGVLPGAKAMLDKIRESGLKIILLTNRPYAEHCRIYADTLEWLEKNDLKYDAIIWARDKGFEAVKNFKNVCWAIDDTFANAERLKEAGIPTIFVSPSNDQFDTRSLLNIMLTCKDIKKLATDWENYTQEAIK